MRRVLALLSLPLASCSTPAPAPSTRVTPMSGVAAVAGQEIDARQIEEVARARQVAPADAVGLIASEARLAHAADERGLGARPDVLVARRAALANALLQSIKRDADARPPTHEELDDVRRDHWAELDRPEALQVIHAVARAAPESPERAVAKALAARVREAVEGATSADDFKARASAVTGGVALTVEPIGPFVRDGRVADSSGATLDRAFVDGAFALARPLDLSQPVASAFGVHVIMLVERLPPVTVTDEALSPLAGAEVRAKRAHRALEALRERRRTTTETARNAEELFQLIAAAPTP